MVYTTADFDYELPVELIAQQPLADRTASRLVHVKPQESEIIDHCFNAIEDYIDSEDLVIFNDTRVFPARIFGQKTTGGNVECLIERIIDSHTAWVQLKASKSPKAGSKLLFQPNLTATVICREADLFQLEFELTGSLLEWLERNGTLPLPPYITRHPDNSDKERYQTVFADKVGAVAAPTAGLHFDQAILAKLRAQGVAMSEITLHVGAGTFQPVRVSDLSQHRMHHEWITISAEVCAAITACKKRGGRVIAIGTTVLRALEAAAQGGHIKPFEGDTDLFITPGFQFQVVDSLLTNFHLPQSTLLMLVCAFGGYEMMMRVYRHAVAAQYRFFSYGDCMFIERADSC